MSRVRKDMLDAFCSVLLPTCPQCGEATLVWFRVGFQSIQSGVCAECDLMVNIQYDDNEYAVLNEGRKKLWMHDSTVRT